MLLTLSQKSPPTRDGQIHPMSDLSGLLASESANTNGISSSHSIPEPPASLKNSVSWLQQGASGRLFGTANGCVLPPVGELQRSNGGLDILGMLNCSRLQTNPAPSQDGYIDFSVLPKIQSLDQGMVRQQLTDFAKDESGLPHLSVSKVKVPFLDLKQPGGPHAGGSYPLDASSLVDVTLNETSAGNTAFVDSLTVAAHNDLSLLGNGTHGITSWSDIAETKDWNAGTQDIGALLSSTFSEFNENVFTQCVEEIHCYKCKFCSPIYVSLCKDDAASHLAANHAKEVEYLQRGTHVAPASDGSWMCTDLMSLARPEHDPTAAESTESMPRAASFVCGKCSEAFFALKDCQNHMAQVHKVKSSRIREDRGPMQKSGDSMSAKNNAAKKKDLKLRVLSKKRMRREHGCYICEFKGCNVRFRLLDNLEYHYKCHINGSSTFACPECSANARRWSSMAGHLWRQHVVDLELHACDQCSFRTYNLSLLENLHKRTHGDERPFLCDTCGKSFKTNKQLRSHKVLHSGKHGVHGHMSGECTTCRRRFTDRRMLRIHLDTVHKKMKPYLCNYCGYSASSTSTLRMHLRQHTGEKPFACQECDYRTADHNSLRRHKMRHSGEKPYKCPYCNYGCIQSSTYKSHLKNKHPGQDKGLMFSCSICSFHTIKEDTYLTHLADHNAKDTASDASSGALPQQPDGHFLSMVAEAVHISITQPSELGKGSLPTRQVIL